MSCGIFNVNSIGSRRRTAMAKLVDLWDHHDWSSQQYVNQWAEGQDKREVEREEIFRLIATTLSDDSQAALTILDLGAGYGALAQFLLQHFPNARALCQDGSEEMAQLGRQRMQHLTGRFDYVLCDFSKPGWDRTIKGPFDAVVSAIAIHNVRSPEIIKAIYRATFFLVKTGGCFLNFDRMTPSKKDQLTWLQDAGFRNVQCFWDGGRRALVGGYRI
jgi:ubiquinone/menaquinone biosynthesis C-methylase UbiE